MHDIYGIMIGLALGVGQAHWALWPVRTSRPIITPNSVVGAFISRLSVISLVASLVIIIGASPYVLLPAVLAGYFGRVFYWIRQEAY